MAINAENIDFIVLSFKFLIGFLLVIIFGSKYIKKKMSNGKRDRVRFLLFAAYFLFFINNINDFGVFPDPYNVLRNLTSVALLTMIFEANENDFFYFLPSLIFLHLLIFHPSTLDMYFYLASVINMVAFFYLGYKYKEDRLIGLGTLAVIGFLVSMLSFNYWVSIIASVFQSVYTILFALEYITFLKKNDKNIEVES